MKNAAILDLRRKLANDQPTLGLWVTLESPSITELAVDLGVDWVVIDAEHGHLDWKEIVDHLRATNRSSTVALVRIAELNIGLVKRALDIGALCLRKDHYTIVARYPLRMLDRVQFVTITMAIAEEADKLEALLTGGKDAY